MSKWAFAKGIIWFYWDYYQNITEIQHELAWNVNDFGGYKICDLYVNKKYNNYKNEILNYINIKIYKKLVYGKALKYLYSKKIRGMKPNMLCTDCIWNACHYGINKEESPNINHIQSVIMYCDFSDYCTKFSESFRAIEPFESLLSIKERNSEFFWQSKSLREMVECYGAFGHIKYYNSGPFYCGLNILMIMPEFSLRLFSPTSTSKNIEVSMNFATTNGSIIQLNNNGHIYATEIPLFDCGWISNYCEESEILLFGGYNTIRIISIRNMDTKENFEQLFHSLFILDCMLNGQELYKYDIDILDSDILLLNKLAKYSMGQIVTVKTIHDYILNTFKLFTFNKNHITINLYHINDKFQPLSHLCIESGLKKTKYNEINSVLSTKIDGRFNLISSNIFHLFPNIKTITIYTTNNYALGCNSYIFNFFYFLETIILSLSWTQIKIKANRSWPDYKPSWIYILWESSLDIQFKYNQNKIKTQLKTGKYEDCLIICRI